MPFFAWMEALMRAAAAAAAAAASFLLSVSPPPPGLSMLLVTGLRLRRMSDSLRAGERERLSKRDFRGGSVWSKRERLRGSSSAILLVT